MSLLLWFQFLQTRLEAESKILQIVLDSQTPEQRAILWNRYIDHTAWISLALSRFDGHMEALIEKLDPAPKPTFTAEGTPSA